MFFFFFFFQAEDGIRDLTVTGVQTCALPILPLSISDPERIRRLDAVDEVKRALDLAELVPFRYLVQHVGSSRDRKSTRLNSSHSQISYAVFCLKKKKQKPNES